MSERIKAPKFKRGGESAAGSLVQPLLLYPNVWSAGSVTSLLNKVSSLLTEDHVAVSKKGPK